MKDLFWGKYFLFSFILQECIGVSKYSDLWSRLELVLHIPLCYTLCVVRGNWMGWSFGWDRKKRGPVSRRVWHDKDPSLLKSAERRPKFCSPSPVKVTSLYKWNILERDVKQWINNQSKHSAGHDKIILIIKLNCNCPFGDYLYISETGVIMYVYIICVIIRMRLPGQLKRRWTVHHPADRYQWIGRWRSKWGSYPRHHYCGVHRSKQPRRPEVWQTLCRPPLR
jgi:hypothetical protein